MPASIDTSCPSPLDLGPGYRELAPPPALRGAVECLWIRVVPAGSTAARVLPDACTDLVWQSGSAAFVAGPDTGPVVVATPPGAVIAGVRFRPGAGGAALGHPLDDLRDVRVPVSDLLPGLERALAPELSPATALDALAGAAARLVAAGPPDPAVGAAARLLARRRVPVATLADQLGLSARQLHRRCRAAVGYGPKTLDRVLRFRRFLALVDDEDRDLELAHAAAEAGYADQPHLTRDCARLAGLSPAVLLRSRRAPANADGGGRPG